MSETNKWLAIGSREEGLQCLGCASNIAAFIGQDHHPRICPHCQVESLFFDLGNSRLIQILPHEAPEVVALFVRWSQQELDELEFLELVVHLELIAEQLDSFNTGED
ncbi:MAG: hypothetical protein AAF433_13480 [Bacteroidota bacterium]